MIAPPTVRRFVPLGLNPANFTELEPLYLQLLDRPLTSPQESEQWLADFSELAAVVDEYANRRYIEKSCHTDDPAIESAYLHFVEQVEPKTKPLYFRLQQKWLQSIAAAPPAGPRYAALIRQWKADVSLFRQENVPLETQIAKLNNDGDKINGAMMASFRGQQYTLQQAARFIEEPDRALRQEAWEAIAKERLAHRGEMDAIFDRLLPLRATIAKNAGLADYRAFCWTAYKRFDYTPQNCLGFADAIEQTCVPVVDALDQKRRQELGVDRMQPWDLAVDPKNRPALRPFDPSNVTALIDGVKTIFTRLSPRLAEEFETLRTENNLDLQSRKGKQPGGYQCSLEESRQPFIFMNAAGLQRDVETLLHEGGHAFHFMAAAGEPLVFLRNAPMEFCEVASMSMELLGSEHFDVFYSPDQAQRAKRSLLEGIIRFLPWMATIDSFQHWIYTHPGHSPAQRTAHWLSLMDRFSSKVDWTGYEEVRASFWQRQRHLFHSPFYYIEYGIAQLGALQLWLKAMHDPHGALASYRAALALGGTRTLPELFAAAGISFDFSQKTLGPLMRAVREALDASAE